MRDSPNPLQHLAEGSIVGWCDNLEQARSMVTGLTPKGRDYLAERELTDIERAWVDARIDAVLNDEEAPSSLPTLSGLLVWSYALMEAHALARASHEDGILQ